MKSRSSTRSGLAAIALGFLLQSGAASAQHAAVPAEVAAPAARMKAEALARTGGAGRGDSSVVSDTLQRATAGGPQNGVAYFGGPVFGARITIYAVAGSQVQYSR